MDADSSSSAGLLLIRADAGPTIGTGHVLRCLALAQAWRDAGGEVILATAELPVALAARWRAEIGSIARIHAKRGSSSDAAALRRIAAIEGADWITVDGYEFPTSYLADLRELRTPLAMVDDMVHLERYPVDLLLNQNLSASPARYLGRTPKDARLLLGPRFSLLRREFRVATSGRRKNARPPSRVLVTFGGADAENYTERILANLAAGARTDFTAVVLIGSANPHVAALQQQAARLPFACEVRIAVDNVAAVMAWADAAISAGGSTVWELAASRLPAVIGAVGVDQLAGMAGLAAVPFFRVAEIESWLAEDMSQALASLPAADCPASVCDAFGATRVVEAMLTPAAHLQQTTWV